MCTRADCLRWNHGAEHLDMGRGQFDQTIAVPGRQYCAEFVDRILFRKKRRGPPGQQRSIEAGNRQVET